MSEGDKVLLSVMALVATILGMAIKQTVWMRRIMEMLAAAIAVEIAKHSKWECKYKPPEKPSDGTQKPS